MNVLDVETVLVCREVWIPCGGTSNDLQFGHSAKLAKLSIVH